MSTSIKTRWYGRIIAALCCAGLACGVQGATHTTLNDLRSFSVDQLKKSNPLQLSSDPEQVGVELEIAQQHLNELFADQGFIRSTQAWLSASKAATREAALEEWAAHYAQTLSAGLLLLRDDEIEFWTMSVLNMGEMTEQKCLEMIQGKLGPQVSKVRLQRLYGIMKRIYLAALANERGKPFPAETETTAAILEILSQLPPTERQMALQAVSTSASSSGQTTEAMSCRLNTLLFKGASLASTPSRQLWSRYWLIETYRAAFQGTMDSSPNVVVKGAASGDFEPGAAQLNYPREAGVANITGSMTVKIWVQANGRASKVEVVERKFTKDHVIASDGTRISVEEMFDPVVSVYYMAGRFAPRYKDGKAKPYIVYVPLVWNLE